MENNEKNLVGNIMVCGKAGVGKTFLVNTLLGAEAGKTGVGAPVTQGIERYSVPGAPFVFYDTQGFEIKDGQVEASIDAFINKIRSLQKTMDSNQMIDIVLYCVCHAGATRFEDTEAKFICKLKNELKVPVCIVFTQYWSDPNNWKNDEYKESVKSSLAKQDCILNDEYLKPVLCSDLVFAGGKCPAFGTDEIVDLIIQVTAENQVQKIKEAKFVSLEDACSKAKNWVLFYSGLAAGEVAVIGAPGLDVLALTGTETVMAKHIYDIIFKDRQGYDKNKVVEALTSMALPLAGYIGGPIVFNECVKFVGLILTPFTGGLSEVGAVAVGVAVGFAVAYALGATTVDLLHKLAVGDITLEDMKDTKKIVKLEGPQMESRYKTGYKYAKEHPEKIVKRKEIIENK